MMGKFKQINPHPCEAGWNVERQNVGRRGWTEVTGCGRTKLVGDGLGERQTGPGTGWFLW